MLVKEHTDLCFGLIQQLLRLRILNFRHLYFLQDLLSDLDVVVSVQDQVLLRIYFALGLLFHFVDDFVEGLGSDGQLLLADVLFDFQDLEETVHLEKRLSVEELRVADFADLRAHVLSIWVVRRVRPLKVKVFGANDFPAEFTIFKSALTVTAGAKTVIVDFPDFVCLVTEVKYRVYRVKRHLTCVSDPNLEQVDELLCVGGLIFLPGFVFLLLESVDSFLLFGAIRRGTCAYFH